MTSDAAIEPPRRAWAETWLAQPLRPYLDGRFCETSGSSHYSAINPANGARLALVPEASSADVDQAVRAARRAFESGPWPALPRRERGRLLQRIAEIVRAHRTELATLIALENGKLYREAYHDDMPDTADVFDYYAGWVDKLYGETCPVEGPFLNYTLREPVGVCALIVPWNFPLLLAAWKLAPALAMGNTAVLKPSPFTSLSLVRFFELLHEKAGLPAGVVNLVLGGAATGEALVRHGGVDKVAFTGSTDTGRRIVHGSADSNLKTVSLELGGKSPSIVFDDVPDLDFAVTRSFDLMFSQKGEKCSEPTRFLIQRRLYHDFVRRLAEKAEAVVCGDPFDPASEQGPQCNRPQFEKVLGYIEIGRREGARVRAGGGPDVKGPNAVGFFVRPTIFDEVGPQMRIAREEIFGPVLCVLPFEDEDEAVRLANANDYALAAGLYTRDLARAHRVARRLDAGMVFVNRYGCYDFASPFGGFKQSGWGKEMALHSLDAYTRTKSVWVHLA
ncbi:MAG TPA: aldehyde dehydrogenase family protein [Myxococcota bacterium]|nr:aldehyde dehydrogenase family protein [Myxococcota bacterium]